MKDSDGDAHMRDGSSGVAKHKSDDMKMLGGDEYMRTDHDRRKDGSSAPQHGAGPAKGLGGMGSFYLLCESRKIPRISPCS